MKDCPFVFSGQHTSLIVDVLVKSMFAQKLRSIRHPQHFTATGPSRVNPVYKNKANASMPWALSVSLKAQYGGV